ncbi:MAG: hypothetical protein JHC38_03390 [Thiotrichales bacterium]|jgi:hypothetical protein|nr:hypothetical protein [Thiotrichales bacterium]
MEGSASLVIDMHNSGASLIEIANTTGLAISEIIAIVNSLGLQNEYGI